MNNHMNWYIAHLVFNIQVGADNKAQFDEQVRLIQAHDAHEAFIKARLLGGREEYEFENNELQTVCWKFIDVVTINHIERFTDGMELCSRIEEIENPEQHISYLHGRAQQIEVSFNKPEQISV